jgi:hypothetical protein
LTARDRVHAQLRHVQHSGVKFAGQAMAVSGAASRQHGVVVSDDAADADLVIVKEAHGRCGEDCTGRPSNAAPLWRTVAATAAVRWDLNGHANAPSRLTAFIPCTCELRSRSDAPLLAPRHLPRCCAAPSQATATATTTTPLRVVGLVQWYLPTYCACACTCTYRRAPADIRPPRPQRLMKQEEGGAVATTCDAAEQPVDTAF